MRNATVIFTFMQRMVVMVDGVRTQLQQVEDAALCVVTNLSDAAANSIENDVIDLKDKFDKYVVINLTVND